MIGRGWEYVCKFFCIFVVLVLGWVLVRAGKVGVGFRVGE